MAKGSGGTVLAVFLVIVGLGAIGYFGFTASGRTRLNNFMNKLNNLGNKNGNGEKQQQQPEIMQVGPEGLPEFPIRGLNPEQIRLLNEVARSKEAREDIKDWAEEYNKALGEWAEEYAKQYEI